MVVLVERLTKLYFKLENHHRDPHHHHQKEALDASLEGFRSEVSGSLERLSSNLKPGLEILSLSWFQQCLELINRVNKAFADLVVEMDYPVTKWGMKSAEDYFNYSLHLLDLMNSISSSLADLNQARLSLSHGLSLVENSPSMAVEHLKAIKLNHLIKYSGEKPSGENPEECCSSVEEGIIQQALKEIKSVGYWVCGIVLAGLSGDSDQYLLLKNAAKIADNSPLNCLDARISEVVEKGGVVKEVKELNDAADGLVSSITMGGESRNAVEELGRRLGAFEKQTDGLGKVVDCIFREVLAGRDQMLDGLRQ